MLVLTRKKNDSIVIDGRITVEVLQVKGGGIRLGITAPPEVSILRGELKPFGVESGAEARSRQQQPSADWGSMTMEFGVGDDSATDVTSGKESQSIRFVESPESELAEGETSGSRDTFPNDSRTNSIPPLWRRRMLG